MNENNHFQEQESFGSWVGWMLRTFFFRLLGINLVFLICCVPIVTVPAALCGLHSVIQRYYRKLLSTVDVSSFFKEFLTSFVKRAVLFWAVILIPLAVVIWADGFLSRPLWFALAGILTVAVLLVLNWFVPQLVLLNLDARQALKNAVLLMCIETKTNFALVAIHAVSMTIVLFGLPVSAFLLLFLPVLQTVLTTGITMPVLQRHLVRPE